MNVTPAAAPPLTPNVRMPPAPRRQILARQRFGGIAGQQRVIDPFDARMRGQVARDRQRGLAMPGHPQMRVLDALQQQECASGDSVGPSVRIVSIRAFIVKPKSPKLEKTHAVIAARRLCHLRKTAVVHGNRPDSTTMPPSWCRGRPGTSSTNAQ